MTNAALPTSLPQLLTAFSEDEDYETLEDLLIRIKSISCGKNLQVRVETLASLFISNEKCVSNWSRKCRLMLANCLVHVLRLSDQNQPFPTLEHLETALLFILSQLAQGLQSLDIEETDLALQLLECVVSNKAFKWSKYLKNGYEILSLLFSTMLPIAGNAVVTQRSLLLRLIKGILDDPVLMLEPKAIIPIAEAIVTGPPNSLARALTFRGSDKQFGKSMNKLVVYLLRNAGSNVENRDIDKTIPPYLQCLGVYSLIRELYTLNPKLIHSTYADLAMRLKSQDVNERLECLNVVTRILLLDATNKNHRLFEPFLDRSTDVHIPIRMQSLHSICQLVQVHPKLLPEVIKIVHKGASDSDAGIRCEVAAVCTQIMLNDESSLELIYTLQRLSEEKEIQIQTEAMHGMSKVYKRHLSDHMNLSSLQRQYAYIIFQTLMRYFYTAPNLVNRHIAESLLYMYIFPNTMSVLQYMTNLTFLLCGSSEQTIEAFQWIHLMQKDRRKAMLEWITQRRDDRISKKSFNIETDIFEEISTHFPQQSARNWCLTALDSIVAVNESCFTSFTSILQDDNASEADTDVVMNQLTDIATMVYADYATELHRLKQLLSSLYRGAITSEHIEPNHAKTLTDCIKNLDQCIKTVNEFLSHQQMMQIKIEENWSSLRTTQLDHAPIKSDKLKKYQEQIDKKNEEMRKEIEDESCLIVSSLCHTAVALAESSIINRGTANEKLKRECSFLFDKRLPINSIVDSLEDLLDEDFLYNVSSEELRLEVQRQCALNELDIEEYLNSRVSGAVLGHIVHRLLSFKYPKPPAPPGANLPWMPVMALILNLDNVEVMGNLVDMLTQHQVQLVLFNDALETCIEAYRHEGPGLPLLESRDPPVCQEEPPSISEVQMLLPHALLNDNVTVAAAGDSSFVDKETQTGPEVTPTLSMAASLGKQALETLRVKEPLSNWLKVAILIEHLKQISAKSGVLGWVLADFPQTFVEAALLENAITGQHVRNPDLKDEKENLSQVTLYQSQIVCDPSAPYLYLQPFRTTLTCVVSVIDVEPPEEPQMLEFASLIQELYMQQEIHKCFYCEEWQPEKVSAFVELILKPCSGKMNSELVASSPNSSLNIPDFDIPENLALGLASLWENLEITYLSNLHRTFFTQRAHKQRIEKYIFVLRDQFAEFLSRSDNIQALLHDFQKSHQQMPHSELQQSDVKADFHERVRNLQKSICLAASLRQSEAENELKRIAAEPWLSKELGALLSIASSMIQLELDRFIDSVALLQDYCMTSLQITPPDASQSLRFDVPKALSAQITNEWTSLMAENLVSLDKAENVPEPFVAHLSSMLQGAKTHLEKTINGIRSTISNFEASIKPKAPPSKKEKVAKSKGKKTSTIEDVLPLEDEEAAKLTNKKLLLLNEWFSICKNETELTIARIDETCKMISSDARNLVYQVWISFFTIARRAYEMQYKLDCNAAITFCEFLDMAIEAGASLETDLVLPRKTSFLQLLTVPHIFSDITRPVLREVGLAQKLKGLVDIFRRIAPNGIILRPAFDYIVKQAASSTVSTYLPSGWEKLNSDGITSVINVVASSTQIDWRLFLIRLLNLPVGTQRQLLLAKTNLEQLTAMGHGHLTRERFFRARLWLQEAFDSQQEAEETKDILFDIFSGSTQGIANVLEFLLFSCLDPNPVLGFAKACSVYTGSLVITGLESGDERVMDDLLSKVNLKFSETSVIRLEIALAILSAGRSLEECVNLKEQLERIFKEAEEDSLTVEQRRARQRALVTKPQPDEQQPVTEVIASFLLKHSVLVDVVSPTFQHFSMSTLVEKFIVENQDIN